MICFNKYICFVIIVSLNFSCAVRKGFDPSEEIVREKIDTAQFVRVEKEDQVLYYPKELYSGLDQLEGIESAEMESVQRTGDYDVVVLSIPSNPINENSIDSVNSRGIASVPESTKKKNKKTPVFLESLQKVPTTITRDREAHLID